MQDNLLGFKAAITAFIAALTALWGWFGWAIIGLIILMAMDWLVGSAVAFKRGEWESHKLREGAWHKGGMVLIVLVALATDLLIGAAINHLPSVKLPFTYEVLLSPLVVVWYIVGELGSLAEHAINAGAPVPKWLVQILKAGRKAVDTAGDSLVPEDKDKEETENAGK